MLDTNMQTELVQLLQGKIDLSMQSNPTLCLGGLDHREIILARCTRCPTYKGFLGPKAPLSPAALRGRILHPLALEIERS